MSNARARRLQSTLGVPYTQALKMSDGIESAARNQVLSPETPINPVGEKDLLLLHLLGPTWVLNIYDMEQPYRYLSSTVIAMYERGGLSEFEVEMDYPHGKVSISDFDYLTATSESHRLLGSGEDGIGQVSTQGHPHAVADRINDAVREAISRMTYGRGVDPAHIQEWVVE